MLGTAFCGWSDQSGYSASTSEDIVAMARKLPTSHDIERFVCAQGKSALAFQNNALVSALVDDDAYRVVISGRASWRDKRLKELANERGNARALLSAYQNAGVRSLDQIGGAFSLALIDRQKEEVFLAVDRMGILPITFAVSPGTAIAFATSAECVDAHSAFKSSISDQAVLHYLFYHVVPSPLSIFSAQQKLAPGHYALYSGGELRIEKYWLPHFSQTAGESLDELAAELHETLLSSVSRSITQAKAGAFLSGGIDSSSIAGKLSEIKGNDARTYSIGFEAKGYDEIEYARVTSTAFRTKQAEYYVTPEDVVDAIPRIVDTYDEPFGNSSAVPVYFCARMANDDSRNVLLAGDGGDELFGGNVRYSKQKVFAIYDALPRAMRKSLLEPMLIDRDWIGSIPLLRKVKSYVSQACL
ncbi:MAG: asparagine synthetase B, partial [Gammaproteobacteria bacterium]|nr:asparagine synthetase B [Gammaproteobacteria bacterium]